MNLLLDTHALLWALSNPNEINKEAKEIIINRGNIVYASAVNVWEISIKNSLGKMRTPDNIEEQIKEHGFLQLPITFKHALRVGTLPNIHDDPFDRLLIAQAIEEKLILVTRDKIISQYPDIKIMKV